MLVKKEKKRLNYANISKKIFKTTFKTSLIR
jgi:hypothetical protein